MPNLRDASGQRRPVDLNLTSWVPDAPPYANPGFPLCANVYPSDLGFYRPMPQTFTEGNNTLLDLVATLTNVSGDLVGFRFIDTNAAHYYVTAVDNDADTLHFFKYEENTSTWADVTPVGGVTSQFGSYGRYATFGTDIYCAYGIAGQIVAKDAGDTTPFLVVTDAPRAQDIAVIRGFMVAINVTEFGVNTRNGVSWSAAGDPTNWINPNTDPIGALSVLRGFTTLQGGGRLQRIVPGVSGSDAIIFGQSKIWRMTFIGPPSVWDFQVVEEREGTQRESTVVSDGTLIYYYGLRGWMVFDGVRSARIGAGKVDRAFIDELTQGGLFRYNPGDLSRFAGGLSSAISGEPFSDKLVFWAYRANRQATLANIATDGGDLIVTDQGDNIVASIQTEFNNTLLIHNQTTGEWGNSNAVLQAIGRTPTDRTSSDNPGMIGIDTDFSLVRFTRLETLNAFIDTLETRGDSQARITVKRVWPQVESADVTISLLSRENLKAPQVQSAPKGLEDDAAVPVFESGRYVALRIVFPLDDRWHSGLQGVTAEFADQGLGSVGS